MSGTNSRKVSKEGIGGAIDEVDRKILHLLQLDSSISNSDLAQRVGLSPSACLMRTRTLKERGIILQCTALLDQKSVGFEVQTITFVTISPHNRKTAESFLKNVAVTPQIVECYNITGRWDYLLKIVARNNDAYREFVIDKLIEFPGVDRVETSIILNQEKNNGALPL